MLLQLENVERLKYAFYWMPEDGGVKIVKLLQKLYIRHDILAITTFSKAIASKRNVKNLYHNSKLLGCNLANKLLIQ